jgi:ABC-type Na+ efflux pump permease subunit
MKALILKDIQSITKNSRMFSTLLIVPLVMCVFLPTVFVLSVRFGQGIASRSDSLGSLISTLPAGSTPAQQNAAVLSLLMNAIFPVFFVIIPIMASSVMAASSFVGEKERHTLETLFYCPRTLKQIFQAKVLASFILSFLLSVLTFIVLLAVMNAETWALMGFLIAPGIDWLLILLLISPAFSFIAIAIIIRGSAKSQTMEESQQRAVFLVLPVILLFVGQMTGLMFLNALTLLLIGLVLAVIAYLMIMNVSRKLNYEQILNGKKA